MTAPKHPRGWDGTVTAWKPPRDTATPGWGEYVSAHKVAHCALCEKPWGTGMVFYAPVIITPHGRDLTRFEPCPRCRHKDGTPCERTPYQSGRHWVFWDYVHRFDAMQEGREA